MTTDDVQVVDKDGNTVRAGETVRIEGVTPIVIDLGKRSKKSIRNLKEGRGKLLAEVADTIEQVRANLGSQGAEIVPVILIYRQKTRAKRSASSFLPIPPPFNLLRP
jgi:hypothetical protein